MRSAPRKPREAGPTKPLPSLPRHPGLLETLFSSVFSYQDLSNCLRPADAQGRTCDSGGHDMAQRGYCRRNWRPALYECVTTFCREPIRVCHAERSEASGYRGVQTCLERRAAKQKGTPSISVLCPEWRSVKRTATHRISVSDLKNADQAGKNDLNGPPFYCAPGIPGCSRNQSARNRLSTPKGRAPP